MDENIVIKAEIIDDEYTINEEFQNGLPTSTGELAETLMLSHVVIKTEPKEEINNSENAISIPTELNSDLVLMIINVTIANSCYKDLNTQLLTHQKIPGSYSVIITRSNFYYFPKIPIMKPANETVESTDDINLIDIEKKELERSELNIIENPFRIVISGTTLKASFQIFGKEKFSVPNVIEWNITAWKVSEAFLPLLDYLSCHGPSGVYRVCEGILDEDIAANNEVAVTNLSLVTITHPFLRYETKNCSFVQPIQYKDKCSSCTKWLGNLRGYRKRKSTMLKDKLPDTDVSSTTAISVLSPEDLRERMLNMRSARKCLHQKVKKLEDQLNKLEEKADKKKAKNK